MGSDTFFKLKLPGGFFIYISSGIPKFFIKGTFILLTVDTEITKKLWNKKFDFETQVMTLSSSMNLRQCKQTHFT